MSPDASLAEGWYMGQNENSHAIATVWGI